MKLLLAEDERALSEALVTVLKRNGYFVKAVHDGTSALRQLKSEFYAGAILDVMMPGADGITVLRTLRANGSKMPVMMLTARSEVEDKVIGLDSGADDYLPKPFDTRELLARLRAMMRVRGSRMDEVSRAGNVRLDHATLEMSSEGCSFRLSGKEFQMMKLFMGNPNIPVSAEVFMEKVWGAQGREEEQAVRAYVAFLQKKLGALHADVRIHEVDGDVFQLEAAVT